VGNRSAMIDPNGGRTTYQYDALNRLAVLTDPGSNIWTFGYDAINRLATMTMPNGITAAYAYDADSRLTNLVYQTSSNAVLQSFAYTYDADGNPISVQREDNLSEIYKYDQLNQLTRVDYDSTTVTGPGSNWTTYAYDSVGNRANMVQGNATNSVTTVYAYDAADRLLTVASSNCVATLQWDNNGNLTNQVVNGTNTLYSWDFENRLVTAIYQNGTSNTYSYYPSSSLRHTKIDSTGTSQYVYDGQNELQQLDGLGNLVAQYVYSLGIDSLLARNIGGSQQYYLHDMIGSVTAVADSGQNLLATYRYDVFGAVRRQTGTLNNPYLFTSRTLDQDSGLYYYRARYMNPSVGRFLSVDPVNSNIPYLYAGNAPVLRNDPLGLFYLDAGISGGAILGGSLDVDLDTSGEVSLTVGGGFNVGGKVGGVSGPVALTLNYGNPPPPGLGLAGSASGGVGIGAQGSLSAGGSYGSQTISPSAGYGFVTGWNVYFELTYTWDLGNIPTTSPIVQIVNGLKQNPICLVDDTVELQSWALSEASTWISGQGAQVSTSSTTTSTTTTTTTTSTIPSQNAGQNQQPTSSAPVY
jgi:RHS repeat-associated protein